MHHFSKYELRIVKRNNGFAKTISFESKVDKKYVSILELFSSKTKCSVRHSINDSIVLNSEVELIKFIIDNGSSNERYPMYSEMMQMCIYKENAYLYICHVNGDYIIGDFETLSDKDDVNEIKPDLTIPSKDILCLLLEFEYWKETDYIPGLEGI